MTPERRRYHGHLRHRHLLPFDLSDTGLDHRLPLREGGLILRCLVGRQSSEEVLVAVVEVALLARDPRATEPANLYRDRGHHPRSS
jgi:hypothetical protein